MGDTLSAFEEDSVKFKETDMTEVVEARLSERRAILDDSHEAEAPERVRKADLPSLSQRRFVPKEEVLVKGESPVVDGVRFLVVVRIFPGESPRPLYVTNAYTGEKLPTQVTALTQDGDRWLAQLATRVGEGWTPHPELEVVQLVYVD